MLSLQQFFRFFPRFWSFYNYDKFFEMQSVHFLSGMWWDRYFFVISKKIEEIFLLKFEEKCCQ